MENWKPMNRNNQVAHSMIMNDETKEKQPFGNTNRPILSLEETYQKTKRKQVSEEPQ